MKPQRTVKCNLSDELTYNYKGVTSKRLRNLNAVTNMIIMILCLQTGYIRGEGALGKLQQQSLPSLYTVQVSTEAFDDLSHRSNGISGHHIRVKFTTDFRQKNQQNH